MDWHGSSGVGPGPLPEDIILRPGATNHALARDIESLKSCVPEPSVRNPDGVENAAFGQADKEKIYERRRLEEDHAALLSMSPQLIGKTVTPFLRDHIPGLYAPVGKPENLATVSPEQDPNSRFCYRHRPDSKCRKAADESKMAMIQSELELLTPTDQQAITHMWSLFSAAPSKHRDLMLQGIMTQCCFPQLSHIAREVQDQLKIDFLTALPTEISLRILTHLDAVSLCRAAQVSRRWRELADQDHVWSLICEQHM